MKDDPKYYIKGLFKQAAWLDHFLAFERKLKI